MKRQAEGHASADKKTKTMALDVEAEHLAQAMADVVPLAPDPRGRVRPVPLGTTRSRLTPSASTSAGHDEGVGAEESYVTPGVDRRELRKLKRGDYPPGARLDLHTHTVAEAATKVKQFIDNSRHRDRCICIVHGRGLHSKGNVSILKPSVRECLRRHPAVLAYSDAPPKDGGSGAVYVLLRK